MSFGKNKSKTTGDPGFHNPEEQSQGNYDWLFNQIMGTPTGSAGYASGPTSPSGSSTASSSKANSKQYGYQDWFRRYGAGSPTQTGGGGPWVAPGSETESSSSSENYTGQRSGGLFEQFTNAPSLFGTAGGGTYEPTDFTKGSTYSPYQFNAPSLKRSQVNPEMWNTYSDMINKSGARMATSQIQKMQDEAAYQGRGGGDLADYRAANTNRAVNESTADQIRQLAAQRMGMEYEDERDVNRYEADASKWMQERQSGENQYADQSLFERQKGTEASRQFGANYGLEYLKNALAEKGMDRQAITDLLKLFTTATEAGQKKPTTSSSGWGMEAKYG